MAAVPFIDLPLDKWRWHPSPLAGQVVYALTRSAEGELDVAPKSWIQMAGFGGPLLSLGCSRRHRTCDNIASTGRFTLSFPTIEQARLAQAVADAPRDERVAVSGLSPEESTSGGCRPPARMPRLLRVRALPRGRPRGGRGSRPGADHPPRRARRRRRRADARGLCSPGPRLLPRARCHDRSRAGRLNPPRRSRNSPDWSARAERRRPSPPRRR